MKKLFIYINFFFVATGCKEKFNTNIPSPSTGYLVVEGFISSGLDPTTITLTRTVKLYDTVDFKAEHNAGVNIESESNEIFPLNETGNGVYTSGNLNLNNTEKYRLRIITQDNKEYTSDFATVKKTPDIDSISWTRENGGVKLYINTHDPQNNTRYYKWDYEQTWEFHSTYLSSLIYIFDRNIDPIGVDYRNADHSVDTTIYKCWNTVNSTNINLGSSEKLSKDLIYLPLVYIEPASIKLSVLYSLNLRQYALSHEAYLFFQKIKKNTESLGSIFDAQPSELQGNIHCITDPAEIVIGYIDISEEKKKRIFIRNDELPGWGYRTGCTFITIDNIPDSIRKYGSSLSPTVPDKVGRGIVTFNATPDQSCIDCTLTGSNVRPPFWP
ncbi:MAG TPA: DUF4249 domain-containing protein [Chitinophagaceae bacterium]|nr:DUF4249 domain-containing protein [Chitinophagaceae bacterium]